ncbi:START-like domain protein [Metarhizium album ARSEF 1941]|uniref:START-like domain protein n=1 Tax=Metarhizium album (strain ARSEF 1941) TaxID=1081103 RepID=A0A0B2WQ52_METAS|nr:START-like domain protein [Metarhizium album ARSEF 1941]KHN95125.1 START-like domain protein [Metarhizium album ARSEF 1941]
MTSHHEPLKALAPIDWNDVPCRDRQSFLENAFKQAQIVIDSVPRTVTPAAKPTPTGRARAKTDSAVVYTDIQRSLSSHQSPAAAALSAQLRKEWKEIKTNPKDNPLAISVYRLAGKDGKGAWFARRSVHEGLTFEQWKSGLEREFAETIKASGSPGSGSIRGIGADRNVEHHDVVDVGHVDVFQLSAQFPGPTAPRDFITLLLTSDFSHVKPDQQQQPALRQYMVVSRPCLHPDCPPRQGIIRGQYESVEIIREVLINGDAATYKRSLSSGHLLADDSRKSTSARRSSDDFQTTRAIEWLMVTRSDPGGSVPRFLIERGTPPGIIGDAAKFLRWISSTTLKDGTFRPDQETSQDNQNDRNTGSGSVIDGNTPAVVASHDAATTSQDVSPKSNLDGQDDEQGYGEWIPSSTGLYGIIGGAFGVASSIASGLRSQFSNPLSFNSSQDSLADGQLMPREDGDDDASQSDATSTRSFTSALDKALTPRGPDSLTDSISEESRLQRLQPAEKDLQKLVDRHQKIERNLNQFRERMETKRLGEKEKDAASQAKLRERHDKEIAKQEAKYKREMRKLEEKREHEQRKAEARRKKAAERQEKSSLTLELEKVRAERDVSTKQIELLRGQVGELQAQNTMLVAKLGRMGALNREDSSSSKTNSIKSMKS